MSRLLQVYANRSNVGDWLSAMGVRSLLPEGETEELLCDGPFVPETLERLAAAGPGDGVLIGGGGLFMEYFRPFWEGFAEIAGRAPFAVWGAGYVDLKAEETRLPPVLLRPILARARVVAVRDALTRDLLDLPGTLLSPCPSALAVPVPETDGHGVLHSANYTTAGPASYEATRAAARAFAEATGRRYRETNNRIEADSRAGLAAVLDLYARSDVVVSSRLHGCIIALAMGRRLVAISGDRKIESFLEPLGLTDRLLDADDLEGLPAAIAAATAGPVPVPDFRAAVHAANAPVAREIRRALAGSGDAP